MPIKMHEYDYAMLNRYLDFVPETGDLVWRENFAPCARKGAVAGTITKLGYRSIRLNRKNLSAHRIVWCLWHGAMPPNVEIDHINRNPLDNRIENLRAATRSQNNQNGGFRKNNASGIKGVSWNASKQKWVANIHENGRQLELGTFANKDDAIQARLDAVSRVYGQYAGVQMGGL